MKVPEIFGENVFSLQVMQEKLPKEVFKSLKKTIDEDRPLDPGVAAVVANAMKDWAVEKGATPLHPLVPADDRHHRRKARLLHHPRRGRQGDHGLFRARSS